MKAIIRLSAPDFQLLDGETGTLITGNRPYLVVMTNFLSQRAALGQLYVLATNLEDSKTDQDWYEHYLACDENLQLALESYLSTSQDDKQEELDLEQKVSSQDNKMEQKVPRKRK